jgi:CRP-like cAMP-binding protein
MNKQLIDYVQKFVTLTEEEIIQLNESLREVKLKKRQFLIQPGFPCKHRSFVVSGAFRSYLVAEDGKEHTVQFAIENWWVSDFNSYIYQQPATLFIVALEDSIVLQMTFEKEQELKKGNHKFETFFRIMAEKGLAFEHRRIASGLTQSAQERYESFLRDFPLFVDRVPQYALASYLGMGTEFLSRIRNKKTREKS